ncbi:MAG: hypothetical protein PHP85_09840 [Gallionella sp.]|nr:hypothetical protein [Gallionella sp.]
MQKWRGYRQHLKVLVFCALLSLAPAAEAVIDVSKSLSPINILTNQTSTMTLVLVNSATTAGLNAAFTDTLPAGMVADSVLGNGCGGTVSIAPTSQIALTGATIPAGTGSTSGTCTITVRVIGAAVGNLVNTIPVGGLTTSNQGSNPASASATLTVSNPANLTASKTFNTTFIHGGGTTISTITLTNPNSQALTGAAFTDTLPAGLAVNTVPAASTTCAGGAVSAVAMAGSFSLSGGTIPANGSCTIVVTITSADKTVAQNNTVTNTLAAGAITTNEGATNAVATGSLGLAAQIGGNLTKVFGTPTIVANGQQVSTLTLTLQNRNLTALTGATLTDNFPAGMVVAAIPAASKTCVGGSITAVAGASSFSVTGVTIPASANTNGAVGSCTMQVNVVATTGVAGTLPNAIPAGDFADATGPTTFPAVSANLTTTAPVVSVSAKVFAAATEAPGGISTMTITLSSTWGTASNITSFTDLLTTMGAGFTVAAAPLPSTTCGGTVTAPAGGTSITKTDGAIPATVATNGAAATCTITVPVQLASTGLTAGAKINTIQINGLQTSNGNNTAVRTGTLTVAFPTVTKVFSPNNGAVTPLTTTLTITLRNFSSTAAAITSFADNLATMGGAPGGFTVAAAASTTCAGAVLTAAVGTTPISLAGGTIPANGTCTITVPVQVALGTPAGVFTNTVAIGALVTDRGNNTATGTATFTVTTPSVSKVFSPSNAGAGVAGSTSSTLTITLTNPSANPATLITSAFTDNLTSMGAGITIATAPAASTTCTGGAVTATPGTTLISLPVGSIIPALGSCTITVPVNIAKTVAAGNKTNTVPIAALKTDQGNNAATGVAVLTVSVPSVSAKTAVPATVVQGQTTTFTVTLKTAAANTAAATITSFTDDLAATLGAGWTIASAPVPSSTCVGHNLSAPAGGTVVTMTAGTIPASGGTCTITFGAVPDATAVTGVRTNTVAVAGLQTTQGNNTAVRSINVTVNPAFTCGKAYAPATVYASQNSVMTVTLTNAVGAPAFSGLAFSDTLPLGQTIGATPGVGNTCGGTVSATAGSSLLSLSGGNLPSGSSCSISVNITAPAAAGVTTNTIPAPTATGGYTCSTSPSAGLTVTAAPVNNVIVNKSFNPATANGGADSELQVLIDNTSVGASALSNITVTDNLPAGMIISANPTPRLVSGACSMGTITAVPSATSFTISGATMPAGAQCTWGVRVGAYLDGNLTNTIPASSMTSAQLSTNTNSPSATLTVLRNVNVTKNFSPATIGTGGTSTLNILVFNSVNVNRTQGAFTDTLPAGMTVAAGAATNACGGVLTAAIGGNTVSLAGGSFLANSTCLMSVPVTVAVAGTYVNNIAVGAVSTFEGSSNPDAASASLVVVNAPTIAKAFTASTISAGGSTNLTFTLSNTNAGALTGASFTDTLTNMSIATPGAATGTCTGAGSNLFSAGQTGLLSFTGLTIPAAGSCTVIVPITSSSGGVNPNTCTGIISDQTPSAGTGCAVQNLTVLVPPTISKAFNLATMGSGETATLTFTLSNAVNTTVAATLGNPSFTDLFPNSPGQMVVATPLVASTTCVGATVRNSTNTGAAAAGNVGISLQNGSIAAGGSCTVTVNVSAATVGTYNNISSTLVSTNAGTSAGFASATLEVLDKPTIVKDFLPASINQGGNSTLTFTLGNTNALQAFTGAGFTDTLSGMSIAAAGAAGGTCTGAGGNSFAAGASSLTFSGLSIPAAGSCTVTVVVTSSTVGVHPNTSSGVISNETVSAGSASNTASLTVLTTGYSVTGRVYVDVNHNGIPDSAEDWAGGPAVYAKLFAGACPAAGTAVSVQTLSAPAGTYSFTGVAAGNYCIVLSSNATAADTVASTPANWFNGTPTSGVLSVTVAATNVPEQNFGLFTGSRLAGRVFLDNGAGAFANNGVQDSGEVGINGVTVTANQAGCAATLCAAAITDGNGDYVMWLPSSVTGAMTVTEVNLSGYLSTGGQAGNTGGTYTRSTDTTAFSVVSGTNYSGVNFADVPDNQFLTDGAQSAMPGSVVFYPHTFIAGTSGAVSFAVSKISSPAITGWNEIIYVDANCNAVIDAGEVILPASVAVTAAQTVCLLVKEFIPAAAPINAQNALTITATFNATFSGGAVSFNYLRHDTTTAGQATGSGLTLVKSVSTATALPGGDITYTVVYANKSSGLLSSVIIHDATPFYTLFRSASCGVLPLNLSGCVITAPAVNATGSIVYTMAGTLAPGSSGAVNFVVRVQP